MELEVRMKQDNIATLLYLGNLSFDEPKIKLLMLCMGFCGWSYFCRFKLSSHTIQLLPWPSQYFSLPEQYTDRVIAQGILLQSISVQNVILIVFGDYFNSFKKGNIGYMQPVSHAYSVILAADYFTQRTQSQLSCHGQPVRATSHKLRKVLPSRTTEKKNKRKQKIHRKQNKNIPL